VISEVSETQHRPILSKMMNNVHETLSDRRRHEMVKMLSKYQADKAIRGAQGGNPTDTAAKN